MDLSLDHTYIRGRRLAFLSDEFVDKLAKRFNPYPLLTYDEENAKVKEMNIVLNDRFGTKGDMITEWILRQMYGSFFRWPEDQNKVFDTLSFYFNHLPDPKYKQITHEYIKENGSLIKRTYKNLLTWNFHELEDIQELYLQPQEDPRVLQLESKLTEGATVFYKDENYQIVKVTGVQAACDLSRGSKWCTSNANTADYYLEVSPLYIFYSKGKKFAQLHIGESETQFMDLRDRPVSLDDKLRMSLLKSGLLLEILTRLNDNYYDEEDPDIGTTIKTWVGDRDLPIFRSLVLHRTTVVLALLYAKYIIKGRFPEAEENMSVFPEVSCDYAQDVLHDRFKLAEPGIIKSSNVLRRYGDYLAYSLGADKLREFCNDYPDEKKLDSYRWMLFPDDLLYRGELFRKTAHQKRGYRNNNHIIIEYLNPRETKSIWVDIEGNIYLGLGWSVEKEVS